MRTQRTQRAPTVVTFVVFVSFVMIQGCTRAARQAPTARAENLLLVTIDTLRADHVGAYGYARARTPTLDALARGGALFERAYAAAPITLTSFR